jgi:hypothetical protein
MGPWLQAVSVELEHKRLLLAGEPRDDEALRGAGFLAGAAAHVLKHAARVHGAQLVRAGHHTAVLA